MPDYYLTPDRQRCLRWMDLAHSRVHEALEGRPPDDVIGGGWTPKETVAHLAAWQRRLARVLRNHLAGDAPEWEPDWPEPGWTADRTDELNARDRESFAAIAPDEAWRAYDESHADVRALVERFDDDDLENPEHWPWTDAALGDVIAGNTYGHAAEHLGVLGVSIDRPWVARIER